MLFCFYERRFKYYYSLRIINNGFSSLLRIGKNLGIRHGQRGDQEFLEHLMNYEDNGFGDWTEVSEGLLGKGFDLAVSLSRSRHGNTDKTCPLCSLDEIASTLSSIVSDPLKDVPRISNSIDQVIHNLDRSQLASYSFFKNVIGSKGHGLIGQSLAALAYICSELSVTRELKNHDGSNGDNLDQKELRVIQLFEFYNHLNSSTFTQGPQYGSQLLECMADLIFDTEFGDLDFDIDPFPVIGYVMVEKGFLSEDPTANLIKLSNEGDLLHAQLYQILEVVSDLSLDQPEEFEMLTRLHGSQPYLQFNALADLMHKTLLQHGNLVVPQMMASIDVLSQEVGLGYQDLKAVLGTWAGDNGDLTTQPTHQRMIFDDAVPYIQEHGVERWQALVTEYSS